MEVYGPVVPLWVQAVIIFLVIFVLGKYNSSISLKWIGTVWGVICLLYLLIVAFRVDYLYSIISTIVGVVSAMFFYKIISIKSKMPQAASIAIAFVLSLIWVIVYMFILGLIFRG